MVTAAPFHSWIPKVVEPLLIHHFPSAGFAPGAADEPSSSSKSTSARTMKAEFETPNNEYAESNPYSFNSLPCIGVLLAVFLNVGTPKRSTNSFCEVTLYALPALAFSVPAAVAVPAAFNLSCDEAITIRGVVPGSAGV